MKTYSTERGPPAAVLLDAHEVLSHVRDEALFMLDLRGRIASWSQSVQTILGWDENDWTGQPLHVIYTPEDVRADVPRSELHLAEEHGCAESSRSMCRKSGERFFAKGALSCLRDRQDHPVGFLMAVRDETATNLVQREQARRLGGEDTAEDRADVQGASLAAAIEALTDGVIISSHHGLQRCNRAALDMLGVGDIGKLQLAPEHLVQFLNLRTEREGRPLRPGENPFRPDAKRPAESREMWLTRVRCQTDLVVRCATTPIVLEGQSVGAVTVLSDLRQSRQLRERGLDLDRIQGELQVLGAEMRAIFACVRDYAIFTLDTQGRIASWASGAWLMKGYTDRDAVGQSFEMLFTAEDRVRGLPAEEMAIAARTGEYKGEGMRVRRDGSVFNAAVVLTALRDDGGKLLGYIKITQNISERHRREREQEQTLRNAEAARIHAERASKGMGEFLATISHELRTPLSAILGWAHVLERGVSDKATVNHGLSAISRNARLQVQLIEDLLDMNRIETGQLRLDVQRIELGGVIASAIDLALPAASAKNISLRTVFGPESGPVMGDAARLLQVVGNLLNNAIKFTPAGGHVSVTLRQRQGQAQIAVADTGQGVAPEFLARMFDRFQQQDATTTRRHGGLGIGLPIVRHLVQLHGGTVQAHSLGAGQGSTFTVLLPAAPAAGARLASLLEPGGIPQPLPQPVPQLTPESPQAATDRPPAQSPQSPHSSLSALARLDGVTVLLIDDEPDVRAVTAHVLRDSGARVLAASCASEGLSMLSEHHPNVIVSDIGMPGTDGYELMRQVRCLPADRGGHTPAAAFTAYTSPEDVARSMAAGYQVHLTKPMASGLLVAALARLAAHSAA